MHKEIISYTDYNGIERTETFWFNLSKAEAMELECSVKGGLTEYMKRLVETQDTPAIMEIFKKLVLKSYGEKTTDGRRFVKSDELSKAFSETPAYSILFMKISTNTEEAAKFFNGVVPNDVPKNVENEKRDSIEVSAYTAVTGNN